MPIARNPDAFSRRTNPNCTEALAARVFGCLGMKSVDLLAAAGNPSRRGPARWSDMDPGVCWPLTAEQAAYHAMPEVSLDEALADPIVQSLMAADRVDPDALEADLHAIAKKLARLRHGGALAAE